MDDNSPNTGSVLKLRVWLLIASFLTILMLCGCANISGKPPKVDVATSESTASNNGPEQPSPSSPEQETEPSPRTEEAPTVVTLPAEPEEKTVTTDSKTSLAKIESAPPKTTVSPPVIPEPEPREALPQPEKAAPPPLDLKLLEKRLKETSAIGIFTKLALKNQVDDLLDKFRAFYKGQSKTSLTQLRQPYEMLIMKVLALLQDNDPKLADDLLASREAIWDVLSDPEKFAGI